MTTATITDPKVAVVMDIYAAFGRGDVDAILGHVCDDVDWAPESATAAAPWHGHRNGKAEVPLFFQGIFGSLDTTQFDIVSVGSNDTDVFVIIDFGVTVKSTGRPVSMRLHHWWRFRDGKIALYRGSEDTALMRDSFAATA